MILQVVIWDTSGEGERLLSRAANGQRGEEGTDEAAVPVVRYKWVAAAAEVVYFGVPACPLTGPAFRVQTAAMVLAQICMPVVTAWRAWRTMH